MSEWTAPPCLQALVEKAGRRRAAELHEPYDPKQHPGWINITEDEFTQHQQALRSWKKTVGIGTVHRIKK